MMDEEIFLTYEEYLELKKAFDFLQCLKEQGVVNWENYNKAFDIFKVAYVYE
jgi:hypothetical protein